MGETTEEAVLLALDTREELFGALFEMLSSENYVRVLMAVEEGKSQTEIAEELGIGNSTVSRAVSELEDFELIEQTSEGYVKTLPSLSHPMIQHYFKTEVVAGD